MVWWKFPWAKQGLQGYEKQLNNIAENVVKTERRILRMKYIHRKLKRRLLIYGLLGTTIIIAYTLHAKAIREFGYKDVALTVGAPLFLFLLIKALDIYYNQMITWSEDKLETYRISGEELVEEVKKATNFDSTRTLLEKFGVKTNSVAMDAQIDHQPMIDPQSLQFDDFYNQNAQHEFSSSRTWTDRLFDLILGEETQGKDQFALICEKCHTHNGLAPPGQLPKDIQYRCPNCGYMNNAKSPEDIGDVQTIGDLSENSQTALNSPTDVLTNNSHGDGSDAPNGGKSVLGSPETLATATNTSPDVGVSTGIENNDVPSLNTDSSNPNIKQRRNIEENNGGK